MMGGSGRQVGVMVPNEQLSSGTGTPRTIQLSCDVQFRAVNWADDQGRCHAEILMRIGGIWHKSPNGESFIASLRGLKKDNWLAVAVEEQYQAGTAAATASIPKEDAVDPVGGE